MAIVVVGTRRSMVGETRIWRDAGLPAFQMTFNLSYDL